MTAMDGGRTGEESTRSPHQCPALPERTGMVGELPHLRGPGPEPGGRADDQSVERCEFIDIGVLELALVASGGPGVLVETVVGHEFVDPAEHGVLAGIGGGDTVDDVLRERKGRADVE